MNRLYVSVFGLSLTVLAPACTRKAPEPAATIPVAAAAPTTPAPAAAVEHGKRKQRMIDPPVYVDGKPVAVMRFAELPPAMPAYAKDGGTTKQFYRLADYVTGLGVSLDKVKSVHIGGKQRIWGAVTGAELRADKGRFLFHFTRRTGGKPSTDWDTTGLNHTVRIDYFTSLAIFVEKDVPDLSHERSCYLQPDGECSDKVPYVDGDMPKGTRVYVDGRLTNVVKRRLVKDDAILEGKDTPSPHYSLARYLESVGVDTKAAKAVEFVADDDSFVGRATQAQWKSSATSVFFTLPAHKHGKVIANLPADLLSKEATPDTKAGMVDAILVYRNATPPKDRQLVTFDDASPADESKVLNIGSGTGYGESDEEM